MAGGGVDELSRDGIDAHAGSRDHLVVVHVAEHPLEDLGGRHAVEGIGVEHVPLTAHHRGRGDAPAAHVADAELEDPVGPPDRVVPVAADLDPGPPARYSPASPIPGALGRR